MTIVKENPTAHLQSTGEAFAQIARESGLTPAPVVVLIPAYKPQASLIELVASIKQAATPDAIVVVDDGSASSDQGAHADEYAGIFSALRRAGAKVFRYTPNRGKGSALKLGLQEIRKVYPKAAVITADADGQHTPEDIARIATELRANSMFADPQPLVLGIRRFGKDTPLRSRVGNWAASALFYCSTGQKLRDTQTGLRGIPAERVDMMLDVPGERYEYELAALLKAARSGVELSCVDIETVYEDNNAGSHFRPIRDSYRVLAPMLGFAASGMLCFFLDTALFLAFASVITPLWLALAGARVISSSVNFAANRWLVFGANEEPWWKAARNYALLAGGILVGGMVLVQALAALGVPLLWAKVLSDAGLFATSYAVQARWARRK